MQAPNKVLLRRPIHFKFNPETATSNSFQNQSEVKLNSNVILDEWNSVVELLTLHGIRVYHDFPPNQKETPDEIFPNNWFSLQPNGELILYPLEAKNRQLERNTLIIDWIKTEFYPTEVLDLSPNENNKHYLEGTGSIVFDHDNRIAYCCESSRSNIPLFERLCHHLNYKAVSFLSVDLNGKPIYHTNVVMSVGTNYVVICLESIDNQLERSMIKSTIENSGKELIDITFDQMNNFCGNIIELSNDSGDLFTIMSTRSFEAFNSNQKAIIKKHSKIIHTAIPNIELIGGGGIRCMIAGLHL